MDCESLQDIERSHARSGTYGGNVMSESTLQRPLHELTDGKQDVIDRSAVLRRLLPSALHVFGDQRVPLNDFSFAELDVRCKLRIVIKNLRFS